MIQQIQADRRQNFWATILWAGLLVGTLDISGAIINYTLEGRKNPEIIFQYIASAAFGKTKAYSGGTGMMVMGGVFHYLIAYSFTIFFFLVYPSIKLLWRNRILTGILYGAFIWCVMNLIIVPITLSHKLPVFNTRALIQMMILIVAIGIPLSFIAHWYYGKSSVNRESSIVNRES